VREETKMKSEDIEEKKILKLRRYKYGRGPRGA